MTSNNDILSRGDELCKYNATLYIARHELWRIEEKCYSEYIDYTSIINMLFSF